MIPKECRRLAEVDFPIAAVSKHAAREKSIRHGHPSTLHLWWARRPLASCRAVLLGLLLPDPCDPHCPEAFKHQAREILSAVRQPPRTDAELRKALLWFIGTFADWDLASHETYLRVGRELVRAAYPEEPPLAVDPFAGGGSIPLEALRLGCEAFASDLNPVACLILKVMLEDIPRHGPKLAEELRRVGAEIKAQAEKELADLYPTDPDGATPIAYLWARTVRCEAPNCGAEIPLARSFWLCKKANRKRALRHRVVREPGQPPRVEFEIFEPKSEAEVPKGTVTRARATCICCGTVLPPERVRAQLAAQRGGADVAFAPSPQPSPAGGEGAPRRVGGARMLAVVTLKPGEQGRHYRLPTDRDYEAVWKAQARLAKVLADWERGGKQGPCPVPDEPLPPIGTLGFRVQRYGLLQWGDLFTARQKVVLVSLASAVRKAGFPLRTALAMALGRTADGSASLSGWLSSGEEVKHVFARQALPIVWDFGESNYLADASRSWLSAIDSIVNVLASGLPDQMEGQAHQADATQHVLPDETAQAWFTDPPYYDAVPYADLSDFFFVWLKRTLPGHPLLRDPFDPANPLTPKEREVVQDETKRHNGRAKDRVWFEETMARAFAEGRRVLREDGVGAVVFAHKTTEGWEALLSGMIRGGWTITGSWPIATEMGSRLRARESAALATSVHLICRPRPSPQPSPTGRGQGEGEVGDWGEVLRELPWRVGDWMERLQGEGIRGADLVFACIGPALEIFSRFARVETAEGREVSLAEYLEKVWEVVGRIALENVLGTDEARARNGAIGALEEDARLTALFLWTLQSTSQEANATAGEDEEGEEETDEEDEGEAPVATSGKGYALVFDIVRRFAQPLGIDLPKWDKRIIRTEKGVVYLLPVRERATQLFGRAGADALAARIEDAVRRGDPQLPLFAEEPEEPPPRRAVIEGAEDPAAERERTTLDRVHMAMLLQAAGRSQALRSLLKAEVERGPEFLRLANALSALYPQHSEEKRLLDAMLLAVPR